MDGHMNIKSIDSIKYGDVDSTGVMQATLTTLYGVKEGTGTLTIPMQDNNKIYIEESPIAFASINSNRSDAKLEIELIGTNMTQMADLFGATRTAADATDPEMVEFASTDDQVYKAFQMTGKNDLEEDIVINIPRGNILAGIDTTVTKTDMIGYTVMVDILQPFNTTTGAIVDPYLIIEGGTNTA